MKVLIGHDGSSFADAAIDDLQRAGLPADTHALVMAVADVWPSIPPVYRDAMTPGPSDMSFAVTDAARQMTQAAQGGAAQLAKTARDRVAAMFPTWTVDCEALSDSPANAPTQRAEQGGGGLVGVGSPRRGGGGGAF